MNSNALANRGDAMSCEPRFFAKVSVIAAVTVLLGLLREADFFSRR